jgi:hypothetical protein
MVDPAPENTEEKPLDPAVARVQVRLQRLMLIAGLTLGVGILAVFFAIVYRITVLDNKAEVVSTENVASKPAVPVSTTQEPAEIPTVEAPAPSDTGTVGTDTPAEQAPQAISDPDVPTLPAPDPTAPLPDESAGPVPVPVPSPTLPALDNPGQVEAGSVPPGTEAAVLAAKATVPADARLVASTVAGGRIVLTYDHFAGTIVMIVDPETLEVVGRLDLVPE